MSAVGMGALDVAGPSCPAYLPLTGEQQTGLPGRPGSATGTGSSWSWKQLEPIGTLKCQCLGEYLIRL